MELIRYEQVIDAPAAQVFALVSDVQLQPRWLEPVQEARWLGDERGPGARFKVTRQEIVEQGEVTEREPNRRFGYEVGQLAFAFDLQPVAARVTRLTLTARVRGDSWVLRLLAKLLGSKLQQVAREQAHGSLERLKTLAESR